MLDIHVHALVNFIEETIEVGSSRQRAGPEMFPEVQNSEIEQRVLTVLAL